jgi:hypothetical protein
MMAVRRHYGEFFARDRWLHGYATAELKERHRNWWFAEQTEDASNSDDDLEDMD